MPAPKRALSLKIEDFNSFDQELLRAAWTAYDSTPMVLIGFGDRPRVIALGHTDGLTTLDLAPEARSSTC